MAHSLCFGTALLSVINGVFLGASIPACWQSSILIPVPKSGDLTSPDNYRGISVTSAIMKLLMTAVATRLENALESHNRYHPAQALRRREECPPQIAALLEVSARREALHLPTYALFVDFQKAYDTVPHELLFLKLDHLGVRGHMLSFLRALYRDSSFRVRTGSPPSVLSDPIPLTRGLRQGCPASPTLFNAFINDIFDECRDGLSCGVPDCSDPAGSTLHIPGFLYADDSVAIVPCLPSLDRLCTHYTAWGRANFMHFNTAKCGVMALGKHSDPSALRSDPARWQLCGEPLPIVDTYKYLGAKLHCDLHPRHLVADRHEKGRRLLHILDSFFSARDIPVHVRILVLKAYVLPVFTYGSGVWGMLPALTTKIQTLLNRTLHRILGLGKHARSVCIAPVLREFGLPPVHAFASAQRARIFFKAPTMGTYIHNIVTQPSQHRRLMWSSRTLKWFEHWSTWPEAVSANSGYTRAGTVRWRLFEDPKSAARRVTQSVWDRWEAGLTPAPAALTRYQANNYAANPLRKHCPSLPAHLLPAIPLMMQLRVGAFPTVRRLSTISTLPPHHKDHCPLCDHHVSETVEHLLIDCPRWKDLRDALWAAIGPHTTSLLHRLAPSSARLSTLLLGGGFNQLPTDAPSELSEAMLLDVWTRALPDIATYILRLSHVRMDVLRQKGLAPSHSLSRTGRRPHG